MKDIIHFTLGEIRRCADLKPDLRIIYGEARCHSEAKIDLQFIFKVTAKICGFDGATGLSDQSIARKGMFLAAQEIAVSGHLDPMQDYLIFWDQEKDEQVDMHGQISMPLLGEQAASLSGLTSVFMGKKAIFERSVKWLKSNSGAYHLFAAETLEHMRVVVSCMRDSRSLYMKPNAMEHAAYIENAARNMVARKNPNHRGYVQAQTTLLNSLERARYRMT